MRVREGRNGVDNFLKREKVHGHGRWGGCCSGFVVLLYFVVIQIHLQAIDMQTDTKSGGVILSQAAGNDFTLQADPQAEEWRGVTGVYAEGDTRGKKVAGHRTEIRSRWTERYLYFLFVCPYEELYLKSNPATDKETNKLWEWDVAEVFIGTDFRQIKRYAEFQVSPQGEWVDLFIDRGTRPPSHDAGWDSGFEVKASIDQEKHIWYGAMKIPMSKLDLSSPAAGQKIRINFYRLQGPPPQRRMIAWQPTDSDTYHVPEAFGTLQLSR